MQKFLLNYAAFFLLAWVQIQQMTNYKWQMTNYKWQMTNSLHFKLTKLVCAANTRYLWEKLLSICWSSISWAVILVIWYFNSCIHYYTSTWYVKHSTIYHLIYISANCVAYQVLKQNKNKNHTLIRELNILTGFNVITKDAVGFHSLKYLNNVV